jgi:hypothetical protein
MHATVPSYLVLFDPSNMRRKNEKYKPRHCIIFLLPCADVGLYTKIYASRARGHVFQQTIELFLSECRGYHDTGKSYYYFIDNMFRPK